MASVEKKEEVVPPITNANPSEKNEKNENKAKVDEDDSDSEDVPELEENPATGAGATPAHTPGAGDASAKQSRSEKKSRKAMAKLGMKPVTGILRVTVKKQKNAMFVIAKPDVYKSPVSDTYVIFGHATIEDPTRNAVEQLESAAKAEQLAKETNAATTTPATNTPLATTTPAVPTEVTGTPKHEEPKTETPIAVSATGTKEQAEYEKQVEAIMAQTGASKEVTIKTLEKHKGDAVSAIIELTQAK